MLPHVPLFQLQLQTYIETSGGDVGSNSSFAQVAQMIVPCVSSTLPDVFTKQCSDALLVMFR